MFTLAVEQLREAMRSVIELRNALPQNKEKWQGTAWEDEDILSIAESRLKSAISVAKHKTPDIPKLLTRLHSALDALTEVVDRRPQAKEAMEKIEAVLGGLKA